MDMSNMQCKNVTYLSYKAENGLHKYIFKIVDNIANHIRKCTNCPRDIFNRCLNVKNEFSFFMRTDKALDLSVIEKIEKICNGCNEADFYNHIITDNGGHRSPREIHELMEEKYGLKNDDDEWWVAHFIISLDGLIWFNR